MTWSPLKKNTGNTTYSNLNMHFTAFISATAPDWCAKSQWWFQKKFGDCSFLKGPASPQPNSHTPLCSLNQWCNKWAIHFLWPREAHEVCCLHSKGHSTAHKHRELQVYIQDALDVRVQLISLFYCILFYSNHRKCLLLFATKELHSLPFAF